MATYDREEFMNYDEYVYNTYDYSELLHETPKAYLFTINSNNYWIPKSICKNLDKRIQQFTVSNRYALKSI